jgi:hypothetical protein
LRRIWSADCRPHDELSEDTSGNQLTDHHPEHDAAHDGADHRASAEDVDVAGVRHP